MKFKNAVAGVAAAVGLGAAALAGSGIAQADESSYLADINQGIGANEVVPGTWLSLGYAVCNIGNLADGTTYIYNNTNNSVSVDQAQFAAESAFMFLC